MSAEILSLSLLLLSLLLLLLLLLLFVFLLYVEKISLWYIYVFLLCYYTQSSQAMVIAAQAKLGEE